MPDVWCFANVLWRDPRPDLAQIWGILRQLAAAGLIVLADKGYIGAGEHVRTPTGVGTNVWWLGRLLIQPMPIRGAPILAPGPPCLALVTLSLGSTVGAERPMVQVEGPPDP
jgi:hypothetical protein